MDKVTPTTADRKLFIELLGFDAVEDEAQFHRILAGEFDGWKKMQKIARHRLATPAPDSEKLREAAERLVLLLDERCKGGFTWSPLMPGETIRAALDDTRAALGAST